MAQAKTGKGESFEASLERLEAIVKEMEDGKLGLESMIERFEEGRKLIGACSKKLNEVERRIEALVGDGDAMKTEPFNPEAPQAAQAEPAPPAAEDCPF